MLAPPPSGDLAPASDEVVIALRRCRSAFVGIAVFSACVNVLALTGSLYMLQISDRVLTSRSISTLLALSLLALVAFLLHGVLDALRCRMLARVGAKFSELLMGSVYGAVTTLPLKGVHAAVPTQAIRDLDQVQKFLSGSGPTAFFDMPFMPIFFIVAFLMHPVFGLLIIVGGVCDRRPVFARREANASSHHGRYSQRRCPPIHRRIQFPQRRGP